MATLISSINLLEKKEYFNKWRSASWDDYLYCADTPTEEQIKLYFYQNQLLIEMGKEGINHSSVCNLFIMLFAFWFNQNPEQTYTSCGGCLLENHQTKVAFAPDLVLYLGENNPRRKAGERRYLDLEKWGIPNLIGEISDTTLASDLDEKKHLYASLKIPEYWVIDILGKRVFCFQLQENNLYKEADFSLTLKNLPISLLNETLALLDSQTNGSVAGWFAQQITQLSIVHS